MAKDNFKFKSFLSSFILGFVFILMLILIFGYIFISKLDLVQEVNEKDIQLDSTPFTSYLDDNYSISFPENYQLNVGKIVTTDGVIEGEKNTIHLISPTLPESEGNLSIIFSFEPYTIFKEEADQGSTCAELHGLELDEIQIGEHIFTTSGQILCGPNEVAFFYVVNGENVYEAKVETTADYETQALPEVLKILETIEFES